MVKEKRFYVYVHRYAKGPRSGDIFYVGKGSGTRVYSNSSRNLYWHNINNKYGRICEILHKELTSKEACEKELELIKEIGKENLCNLSDGGESGALGFSHTEEWKKKMSDFMRHEIRKRMSEPSWVHPRLGKPVSDIQKKKASKASISFWGNQKNKKMMRERMKAACETEERKKKMSEANRGKNNPMHDQTVRRFIHKDGRFFVGTQYQLQKKHNLNQGNTSMMVNGKRKSVSGWSLNHAFS